MLNTSALRSTVFVLALSALLLTACRSGPELYEKEMEVTGYDFTKYTDEGFLITPQPYSGEYQSIGMLTVTVWPRVEKTENVNKQPGADDTRIEWEVTDSVRPQEVVDSLYAEAHSMGADAIMNFRTEAVREDLDEGPTRVGVRAKGFAIDRVED